jgi:hypothetical protein
MARPEYAGLYFTTAKSFGYAIVFCCAILFLSIFVTDYEKNSDQQTKLFSSISLDYTKVSEQILPQETQPKSSHKP